VRSGLDCVVVEGDTREGGGNTFEDSRVDEAPTGEANVASSGSLKIEAAVVDKAEFTGCVRGLGENDVHDMKIVFTLESGYIGVIKFEGAVDAMKEGAEGGNPLSFQVWKGGRDVSKNGGASACHVLVPGGCNTEKVASFEVSAPELKEECELTKALLDVEAAKLNTAKLVRAVNDSFWRVAVVAALGEDASSCSTFDLGKVFFGDVAYRQGVSDTGKVDGVVKRPAFMTIKGAACDDGGFLIAVG